MRALDPEVVDTVWAAIEPKIPPHPENHPLGCHRPRVPDRDCFEVMLVRLVTGCSWEDAERLRGRKVSDTTVRARRDEWIAAGVFAAVATEAITAYDKIIGLDLSGVAVDGANRNDSVLLAPTLDDVKANGLLGDIQTIWLDRGYDSDVTRKRLAERAITDAVIAKKRKRSAAEPKRHQPMGLRWPVERTNSWLSNFGQLRRNTDRRTVHRPAQFALAVVFLLAAKPIDWRNRWSPGCVPIR